MFHISPVSFKNTNLGNVNIHKDKNIIFFIREQRNLFFYTKIKKNTYKLFDGRFLVVSNISGTLIPSTQNYFNKLNQTSDFQKYKNDINNSLPMLQTLEGKVVKPYLNIINNCMFEKENIKESFFGLYLINRLLV